MKFMLRFEAGRGVFMTNLALALMDAARDAIEIEVIRSRRNGRFQKIEVHTGFRKINHSLTSVIFRQINEISFVI
jgi:hypothetical protein